MTLVETVSKITKRQVNEQEAMKFALEQFGLLATHLRNEVYINVVGTKSCSVRLANTLYKYFESKSLKVNLRCIPCDLLINFDFRDFRKFKSVGSSTIDDLRKTLAELKIDIYNKKISYEVSYLQD